MQDTKKGIREAVVKASHKYKNERSLEVSETNEFERSSKSTIELKNPNNEISVTYLLYELQRQYTVSEHLHALTPVILFANEMPPPDGFTDAWLLQHEWILRRILPDDKLIAALDSLTDGYVRDDVSLGILRKNWELQTEIVRDLKGEHSEFIRARRSLEQRVIGATRDLRRAESAERSTGFLFDFATSITGGDFTEAAVDAAAAALEAAEKQLENVQHEVETIEARLGSSQNALNAAKGELNEAFQLRTEARVKVDQLKVFCKQNALFVMQNIWANESHSDRIARLHSKEVIVPTSGTAMAKALFLPGDPPDHPFLRDVSGPRLAIQSLEPPTWDPAGGVEADRHPLHRVADLNRPLGFHGNYTIYPLRECSLITDYMMLDYVDSYFGIREPDAFAEFTTDELVKYRKEAELEGEQLENLNAIIAKRLQSNVKDAETIVVPTGQLYMEALLGTHTLLEPFKLAHRAYDALAAKEVARRAGLENFRYAARLTKADPDHGDPDVDKLVEKRSA